MTPTPDQQRPYRPILGFVAGTPILTADGAVPTEELRPGDIIQARPDHHRRGDDENDCPDHDPHWWEWN